MNSLKVSLDAGVRLKSCLMLRQARGNSFHCSGEDDPDDSNNEYTVALLRMGVNRSRHLMKHGTEYYNATHDVCSFLPGADQVELRESSQVADHTLGISSTCPSARG